MSTFEENGAPDQSRLIVDSQLYNKVVLFRTCYLFTDRCYLYLKLAGEKEVHVYVKAKNANSNVQEICGEFCNELINQQVRYDIVQETGKIRELIVAQAFAEGNLLDEVRETGRFEEDPLGISKQR